MNILNRNNKIRMRNKIADAVALLLILLFIYASTYKLIGFEKFHVQLTQSPLLTPFAHLISWLIIVIELAVSVLLFFRRFRLTGLFASYGVMLLFSGYIITITRFSRYVPCSCGGVLEAMTWNQHLLFNGVFVILTVIAILFFQKDQVNPKNGINAFAKQGKLKTCKKE
jgi:uncharacterized membrane protein YphA (DoxX/SURF4 family)